MIALDAAALRRALPMAAAIDALEAGVGVERDDPLRTRMPTAEGELLIMPAAGPEGVGVKLAGIVPGNAGRGLPAIGGLYVLLDRETLVPVATLDGAALTVLRTAALSGLVTRHLARPNAARLVVFGTGPQAIGHVEAMCAVRPITSVTIVGRTRERAEAACAQLTRQIAERGAPETGGAIAPAGPDAPRVTATAAAAARDALAGADVVCTCTAATSPLFDGADLPPGVHVNAIGSHRAQDRELDTAAVARARVVVEAREPAWAEAGELALALRDGAIDATHVVADLAELVAGAPVRRDDADVTLFKAVGAAFEDLIVAAAAVANA